MFTPAIAKLAVGFIEPVSVKVGPSVNLIYKPNSLIVTGKQGLYYNINKKRKEGRKMRKKGAKGAPTAAAFKRSAKTAKKPKKKK